MFTSLVTFLYPRWFPWHRCPRTRHCRQYSRPRGRPVGWVETRPGEPAGRALRPTHNRGQLDTLVGRSAATPFLAPGGTIAPSILSTIAPIRMPSDDAEPWWDESNDAGRILQGKNSLVTFQAWENLIGIAEKRKSNQCTTNTTAGKTHRATSNNITKTHSFRSG